MSSIEPDDGGGEIDGGEEVACGFIVAGGDGAVLFQAAEEVLDEVPRFVKRLVVPALFLAVPFWRNNNFLCGLAQRINDALIGIIAFVGQDGWRFQRWKKNV